MQDNKNLSVQLYKSLHLPCTADSSQTTNVTNSDRYLEVQVVYLPDCCPKLSSEERLRRENVDRDWFKTLMDLNPNIDNLSNVVDAAAKAFIETVKPINLGIPVVLSGTADKNEFCTKSVTYNWDRDVTDA